VSTRNSSTVIELFPPEARSSVRTLELRGWRGLSLGKGRNRSPVELCPNAPGFQAEMRSDLVLD